MPTYANMNTHNQVDDVSTKKQSYALPPRRSINGLSPRSRASINTPYQSPRTLKTNASDPHLFSPRQSGYPHYSPKKKLSADFSDETQSIMSFGDSPRSEKELWSNLTSVNGPFLTGPLAHDYPSNLDRFMSPRGKQMSLEDFENAGLLFPTIPSFVPPTVDTVYQAPPQHHYHPQSNQVLTPPTTASAPLEASTTNYMQNGTEEYMNGSYSQEQSYGGVQDHTTYEATHGDQYSNGNYNGTQEYTQDYTQEYTQEQPQVYTNEQTQDYTQDYSQGYTQDEPQVYSQEQPQEYSQDYSQGYTQEQPVESTTYEATPAYESANMTESLGDQFATSTSTEFTSSPVDELTTTTSTEVTTTPTVENAVVRRAASNATHDAFDQLSDAMIESMNKILLKTAVGKTRGERELSGLIQKIQTHLKVMNRASASIRTDYHKRFLRLKETAAQKQALETTNEQLQRVIADFEREKEYFQQQVIAAQAEQTKMLQETVHVLSARVDECKSLTQEIGIRMSNEIANILAQYKVVVNRLEEKLDELQVQVVKSSGNTRGVSTQYIRTEVASSTSHWKLNLLVGLLMWVGTLVAVYFGAQSVTQSTDVLRTKDLDMLLHRLAIELQTDKKLNNEPSIVHDIDMSAGTRDITEVEVDAADGTIGSDSKWTTRTEKFIEAPLSDLAMSLKIMTTKVVNEQESVESTEQNSNFEAVEPVEEVYMEHKPDELVDSVENVEEEAVVEEPVEAVFDSIAEEPVFEFQVDKTEAESTMEDNVVESIVEEPVVELIVEEQVVESIVEEPVVEAIVEEPVVESIVVEPVVESIAEEPIVETTNEPVVDSVTEELVEEPVVEVNDKVEEAIVPVEDIAEGQFENDLVHAIEETDAVSSDVNTEVNNDMTEEVVEDAIDNIEQNLAVENIESQVDRTLVENTSDISSVETKSTVELPERLTMSTVFMQKCTLKTCEFV